MRKGTKIFLAASLVAQLSAVVRYVILARLLGPHELGLAAMLILTAQFFDTVSDTGSDRFIVQDPKGDSPKVLGLVHLVLAGRGVLLAFALIVTSGLVSGLYRAPEIQVSLMVLALSPLIAGFSHLDVRRAQRTQDFRPESIATIASEIASTASAAIAAYITRDHTAIIYGLVVRSATWVLVSNLTASTPYRWAFSRTDAARFSAFATPLFLNGVLLYFGSQGDRIIIGRGLGPEALGHYSAILLLALYPASMATRFIGSIHMPLLAGARDNPKRYELEEEKLAGRTALISVGMVAGFVAVAPIFTLLFYGKDFAQPLPIFALLAILQAGRFLRAWPATAAVSLGRSTIVLFQNIARIAGLPVAIVANHYFHSLEAIIGGFIFGEGAALIVALVLLDRASPGSLARDLMRVGLCALGCAIVLGWAWSLQNHWFVALPVLAIASVGVAIAILRFEATTVGDAIRIATSRLERLRRR